jgi:putative cyclase
MGELNRAVRRSRAPAPPARIGLLLTTADHGKPLGTVTTSGAAELSIGVAADGIVGRGVLVDVPRSRAVPWLEPGDHVTVADLLAAERDQQVRIGQGDIVLIRVCHRQRRNELGPWDAAQGRAGASTSPLMTSTAAGSDVNQVMDRS